MQWGASTAAYGATASFRSSWTQPGPLERLSALLGDPQAEAGLEGGAAGYVPGSQGAQAEPGKHRQEERNPPGDRGSSPRSRRVAKVRPDAAGAMRAELRGEPPKP